MHTHTTTHVIIGTHLQMQTMHVHAHIYTLARAESQADEYMTLTHICTHSDRAWTLLPFWGSREDSETAETTQWALPSLAPPFLPWQLPLGASPDGQAGLRVLLYLLQPWGMFPGKPASPMRDPSHSSVFPGGPASPTCIPSVALSRACTRGQAW